LGVVLVERQETNAQLLSNFHASSFNWVSVDVATDDGLTNLKKGIWSITMPDMINPQKEIDLFNNDSIINRILFLVTIFQHSPLTRRVFYNIIRRERGQQHQQHLEH
jgi:hypothetical protein